MTETKTKRFALLIAGGVAIILVAAATYAFRSIGGWLVVQDPLQHADVIVVLSGHLPERALEAARIYHGGFADQVWVSQPVSPAADLQKMNISYLGEDFYNEKVLLAQGVPVSALFLFEKPIENTEEEVREIAEILRRDNATTAIVVTSKPHTRRVRAIWRKLAPKDLHLIVRCSDTSSYDAMHWWRHTRDALDVTREALGLLNVWAGLPIRPSRY